MHQLRHKPLPLIINYKYLLIVLANFVCPILLISLQGTYVFTLLNTLKPLPRNKVVHMKNNMGCLFIGYDDDVISSFLMCNV